MRERYVILARMFRERLAMEVRGRNRATPTSARPFLKPPTNIAIIWRMPHSTAQNISQAAEIVPRHFLLRSRRYRNRRLGEFLKELDLTEGRSTGIPTIQEELAANGSPAATIETDEARTYFILDIPCHPEFNTGKFVLNEELKKDECTKGCTKELTQRQRIILEVISEDCTITAQKIIQSVSQKEIKLGQRTLMKELSVLQRNNFLRREGGRKNGRWIVLNWDNIS